MTDIPILTVGPHGGVVPWHPPEDARPGYLGRALTLAERQRDAAMEGLREIVAYPRGGEDLMVVAYWTTRAAAAIAEVEKMGAK